MKTQNTISMKSVPTLLMAIAFFSIASCQNRETKATEPNIEATAVQTEVTLPDLDIHAATFLGNIKAINQHIKAGTDLNQKDQYGSTPLIIAATFGKTEVAQALIVGGADLNLKSTEGSTPLHTAAFYCRTEIVEALLEHGADKTLKNSYGSTPKETVMGSFDTVKGIYDQISKDLGPLGFKLDYDQLETTRPKIVAMLE